MSRVTPQNSAQIPARNLLTWSLWESNSDKICNFAAEGYYCLKVNETLGVKFPRFMPEIYSAHWQKVRSIKAFNSLQNASKSTSTQIGGKSTIYGANRWVEWLSNEPLPNLNLVWDEISLVTYTLAVPTSLILSWSTWCNLSTVLIGKLISIDMNHW
ncbi:hypothetical protein CPB83DRAFT_840928 [Crepidotus variabilis]|uniref:Uncharacterized protein n=1 Tax=Crepidotus variabilis TaxID=179855 RepID=A0A9P6E3I1_9AGAR|nr:hypothetical protein CPB83DRAFT_840928 [Crepidotus variabilis]